MKSADVKNGALKAADFKAGELPAGTQGPAGPAGPAGAAGVQNPIGPSNAYTVDSGNNAGAIANIDCRLLLGGTPIDSSYDILRIDTDGGTDRGYIPLMGAGTAAIASTATVVCDSSQMSGNWMDRSITAVKVGSIG